MVMALSNLIKSRNLLICLFILIYDPLEVFTKRGGYMNFQFLCYENPGHLDYQGYACDSIPSRNCDPYFTICISNKPIKDSSVSNCPVFRMETEEYNNEESVCNKPTDNRGKLQRIPDIELPYPLQETYYIRIVVKDSDQFNEHQNIAIFSTSFIGTPSPNFNNSVNKIVFMTREENRVWNSRARLTISIGLKCDWNLYGNLCMTFCRSGKRDNYHCSDQGTKICKPGWKGQRCEKKDLCRNLVCAKGASCIYIGNAPKCTCNGMIGPQCYPNYDPCQSNPCLNNGKCIFKKTLGYGINCSCTFPYHGNRCERRFNLCKVDPCRNSGICTMLRNSTRICTCLSPFTGLLCDQVRNTSAPHRFTTTTDYLVMTAGLMVDKYINVGLIFGCLFGLCMLIMSIVGIYFLVKWRKGKTIIIDNEKPVFMKQLSRRSPTDCLTNEYVVCTDEGIYDDINERDTYVYQVENNDDYLVPSRPTTPAMSIGGSSKDFHKTPMCNDDYAIFSDDITNENTRENEYFPSLPTRIPKKKPFQHFFNFKA